MLITIISRYITNIKVFCNNQTTGSWKKSRLFTNTYLVNTCRHIKISVLKAFMNSCHYFLPKVLMEVSGVLREFFIIVIS